MQWPEGYSPFTFFWDGFELSELPLPLCQANKRHPPWGVRNPKSGAAALWHRCAFELRKLSSKGLGWIWTSINSREEQSDPPCSCWVKLKSMSQKVLQRLRGAWVPSKPLGQSCSEMRCLQHPSVSRATRAGIQFWWKFTKSELFQT